MHLEERRPGSENPVSARGAQLRAALAASEQRTGADSVATIGIIMQLASVEMMSGRLDESERLSRRALSWFENSPGRESPMSIAVRQSLAALLQGRGEYAEAEALLKRALELGSALGEPGASGDSVRRLAGLYVAQERLADATDLLQPHFDRARREHGDQHPTTAAYRNELALVAIERGDLEQAQTLLQRAVSDLERAIQAGHRQLVPVLGSTQRNLAAVLRWRGDYDQAEVLYRRSHAFALEHFGPFAERTATAAVQLGGVLAKRGKLDEGERILREALTVYDRALPANHPLASSALLHLGELALFGRGDPAAAEPWLRRLVEISRTQWAPRRAQALGLLAWSLEGQGGSESERLFRDALDAAEAYGGPLHGSTLDSLDDYARYLTAHGRINEALVVRTQLSDRTDQLLGHALAAGSERQRRTYVARAGLRATTHATLSMHLHRAPSSAEARDLALTTVLRFKGRALEAGADATRGLRRSLSSRERGQLDALSEKRRVLAKLVFQGPRPANAVEAHHASLAALREEVERFEQRLGTQSARFRAMRERVTIDRVASRLPARSALIEYAVVRRLSEAENHSGAKQWGPPVYAAYLLKPSGVRVGIELGEVAQIDALVHQLRTSIDGDVDADWLSPARALHSRVVAPLASYLDDVDELLIAPDAGLGLAPFAALVGADGEPLVTRYRFTYLTSGRDLLLGQEAEKRRAGRPVVIGAPDFNLALSPRSQRQDGDVRYDHLPEAERESRAVASVLAPATLWLGRAARERVLNTVQAPRVLHVVTHGLKRRDEPSVAKAQDSEPLDASGPGDSGPQAPLMDDPLLHSGIVLAGVNRHADGNGEDGIVTALELSALDLDGTELVTFSACETALGLVSEGEGVLGLRRALMLAGARAQLLTLWRVDDGTTSVLMKDLYERVMAGENLSMGLRAAQLAIRANPEKSHPFYWASFSLSGMPKVPQ